MTYAEKEIHFRNGIGPVTWLACRITRACKYSSTDVIGGCSILSMSSAVFFSSPSTSTVRSPRIMLPFSEHGSQTLSMYSNTASTSKKTTPAPCFQLGPDLLRSAELEYITCKLKYLPRSHVLACHSVSYTLCRRSLVLNYDFLQSGKVIAKDRLEIICRGTHDIKDIMKKNERVSNGSPLEIWVSPSKFLLQNFIQRCTHAKHS